MNEFDNASSHNDNTPGSTEPSINFAPPTGTPVPDGQPSPSAVTSAQPTINAANAGEEHPIEAKPVHTAPKTTVGASPAGNAYAAQPQATAPHQTATPNNAASQPHPVPGVPVSAAPTGATQVIYGKPKASGSNSGKTFLIAFAGALVACVLAFGAMFAFGGFGNGSSTSVTLGSNSGSTVNAASEDSTLAEQVASKCLPSVVSIDVLGTQSAGSGNSIYDYLYGFGNNGQSDELAEVGLGSGVIISDDGYVITNYHVIEGGQKFELTVAGEQKEAELVGSDASSDIAVLKITDGSGYTAMSLGDSANIKIGEWVMSIGSPFGLEQSVATGIVSATSRSQVMDSETDSLGQSTGEVTIYPNMIQTDAAINPGNSGGALVNANGELIGINTLITSYSGNYSGVGFAIPSNYAISIAQSIISGEEPTRAYLGVTMTTINSTAAQMYGFPTDSGAYISSVVADSPAAKAGLQTGDIIIGFDGQTVSSASDVMLDVRTKSPGDTATITYLRNDQEQTAEVTLGQSLESKSSKNDSGQKGNNSGNSNGGNPNSRNPFSR